MFKLTHPEWGDFTYSGEYRIPKIGEYYVQPQKYREKPEDSVQKAFNEHNLPADRPKAILVPIQVEPDTYTISTTYMQWVARHLSSLSADYRDNQTVELVNVTEEDLEYMRNNNANVIARKAVKYEN